MYNINDTGAAVYDIQRMLRLVSRNRSGIPCVTPDGIYGDETYNCVRSFQISQGLMPTGAVDLDTFNALVNEYRRELRRMEAHRRTALIPNKLEGGLISPGDESALVSIIQAMLSTLEVIFTFPTVAINGFYDPATVEAVSEIQRINGLPVTGVIDKDTWNAISDEYEKYKDWDS